jgi:protein-S-isoprenylcysteine O-methyltransferase Ste14
MPTANIWKGRRGGWGCRNPEYPHKGEDLSFIPAFEIGLCNAWIFIPYLFLILVLTDKLKKGEKPGRTELDAMNKREKRIFNSSMLVFLSVLIYSIFLPLELGTIWFYTGLPIAVIGLAALTLAMINYATTLWDKPATTGLYRYSRHPTYIALAIFLLGVGISSASWLFLLLSLVFTILNIFRVDFEERFCLEKYGDAYRQYMERTPRWLGLPKS